MRQIRTQSRSAKPLIYSGGSDLSIYTYLVDVQYQVRAHFGWNYKRPDLENDRNENKHYCVAKRMIERGGRRDVFLGTRECQSYVEPCVFGDGEGFYDNYDGEMSFGLMFHGFDYPDEHEPSKFYARFWRPKMVRGVIDFVHPDDKSIIRKFVRPMNAEPPETIGLQEEGLLDESCQEKGRQI